MGVGAKALTGAATEAAYGAAEAKEANAAVRARGGRRRRRYSSHSPTATRGGHARARKGRRRRSMSGGIDEYRSREYDRKWREHRDIDQTEDRGERGRRHSRKERRTSSRSSSRRRGASYDAASDLSVASRYHERARRRRHGATSHAQRGANREPAAKGRRPRRERRPEGGRKPSVAAWVPSDEELTSSSGGSSSSSEWQSSDNERSTASSSLADDMSESRRYNATESSPRSMPESGSDGKMDEEPQKQNSAVAAVAAGVKSAVIKNSALESGPGKGRIRQPLTEEEHRARLTSAFVRHT